jgi:hypothetical protein
VGFCRSLDVLLILNLFQLSTQLWIFIGSESASGLDPDSVIPGYWLSKMPRPDIYLFSESGSK